MAAVQAVVVGKDVLVHHFTERRADRAAGGAADPRAHEGASEVAEHASENLMWERACSR